MRFLVPPFPFIFRNLPGNLLPARPRRNPQSQKASGQCFLSRPCLWIYKLKVVERRAATQAVQRGTKASTAPGLPSFSSWFFHAEVRWCWRNPFARGAPSSEKRTIPGRTYLPSGFAFFVQLQTSAFRGFPGFRSVPYGRLRPI